MNLGKELYDHIKTEVDLLLTSVKNENKDDKLIEIIKNDTNNLLQIFETIQSLNITYKNEFNTLITNLEKLRKYKVLTNLTMKDNEFVKEKEFYRNKRYKHIVKINNEFYNDNAFSCHIKKCYNDKLNKEESSRGETLLNDNIKKNPLKVYINKGGSITNSYIQYCIIKQEHIDEKKGYKLKIPVTIPVSKIIINNNPNNFILTVDHREPKLKILAEFYKTPIIEDENFKLKIDIRKYEKLNKKDII